LSEPEVLLGSVDDVEEVLALLKPPPVVELCVPAVELLP